MAQQADGTVYIDTLLDTTGFKAGGKDVEAAVRRMSKTVSGIGATAKIALQKQTDAFVKANQAYAQQEQKVDALKNKLKEMSEQKVATDEFKEIGKQIDNDTAKLNRLEKAQEEFLAVGGKESSSAYRRREMEIEELRNSIKYAKGEQEDLLNTGGAYKAVDTSGVEQKLFNEEQRLQNMNNSLATSYASLKSRVDSYSGSAINLASVKERLGKSFSSLLSTVKKTAKTIGGTLLSALKRAGAAMLNLHKNTKKSDRSIGSSLKTMLKYGLGIRSVFVLVNKLRRALVDGFKNLAQYDGRTNASISSLMSALTQLKNSFATAFAPILNVVAPIFKTFINMVSRAVTYVGMLIAALTGQDSFVRATEVQEDYAASLGDTASGYKKAEKAQNKYLSGLDEIRRWENPNDNNSDNGGGGGYTAPTPGEMFETVPIENSLKDLADKIKNVFAGIFKPFQEAWQIEGEGTIKAAQYALSSVGELAKSVGQSLYDVWTNGTGTTALSNILIIVQNILTTVGNLAGKFTEAWNTAGTGTSIIQGIFDLLNIVLGTIRDMSGATAEWAKTLDFTPLLMSIDGLLQSLQPLAQNIGDGLAWFYRNVLLPLAGFAIEEIIPRFFETLGGVLSILNAVLEALQPLFQWFWDSVLQPIAEWTGGIFLQIWDGINTALQAFATWCEENPEIIQNVAIVIGAFFAAFKLASIITGVITTIQGLIGIISGAGGLSGVLGTLISTLGGPLTLAIAAVIAAGVLLYKNWDKIKDAAGKLKDWIIEKWGLIKDGIGQAWESVKTKTSNIWTGITDFMSDSYEKIKTTFSTIGDWFKEKFETAYTNVTTAFSLIGEWFQGKYEDVQGVFDLVGDWFKSKFDTAYSNVKTAFSGAGVFFSGVWKNIKNSFSHVSDWFENTFSKAWKAVKNVFSTGGAVFVGITTGILNGFKSVVNALIRGINNVITIPFSGINSALQGIKNVKIIDWYPFSWMPTINTPQIPYLATGAVIPPNAPFAAILGDQKHGTNIEAPLSTIEQAVTNAMRKNGNNSQNMTIRIPVILDGRQVFEAIIDEARMKQMVSGRNPFEMG